MPSGCLLTPCTHHADDANDDEGYGEELSHVEHHASLEVFLDVLGILYEEAEGEDERQAQSEEEPAAHADGQRLTGGLAACIASAAAIEPPADEEEDGIGDGLVELTGMARHHVDALEDEGPRYIGGFADYLGVHQVAQAYEAGRDGCRDGDVVQYGPRFQLRPAHIEQQGNDDADGAAMRG